MRVVVPKIVQGISNIVPTIQLAVGFFSKRNVIVWFSHIALGVVLVGGWGICTHIWGGEVTLGWCGRHRRGETTTSHIHDCTQPSMSPCPQGSNIPLEGTHHSDIITCVYHTVHILAPSGPYHTTLCVFFFYSYGRVCQQYQQTFQPRYQIQ